jgi:AcrR family transcriptional regulator
VTDGSEDFTERERERPNRKKKQPSQPRSRKRRRALLDAAEQLLMTMDPDELTHAAIAIKSGIGRTSVYQYFPRITDLLMALTHRYAALQDAALVAAYAARHPNTLEEAVEAIVDTAVLVYNGNTAMRRVSLVSGGRTRNCFDRDYNRIYAAKLRELIGANAPPKSAAGDPMEVIAMTAYSIYPLAVLRKGYIAEFYADHAKEAMRLQLYAEKEKRA